MTLRTLIAAGLITAAGTFSAYAQSTASDVVVITPQQEVVIKEYVTKQQVTPVERPSNFELIVGAIVPDVFKPGELAENTIPDKKYQYVVIDGQTVIVEPDTRKVVHIIK